MLRIEFLYNSATDDTTTSNNLQFDGTILKGTDLEIKVRDNKRVIFGNQDDMVILHDNTNGSITNSKGDLTIKAGTSNGDGVLIRTNDSDNHEIAKFEETLINW